MCFQNSVVNSSVFAAVWIQNISVTIDGHHNEGNAFGMNICLSTLHLLGHCSKLIIWYSGRFAVQLSQASFSVGLRVSEQQILYSPLSHAYRGAIIFPIGDWYSQRWRSEMISYSSIGSVPKNRTQCNKKKAIEKATWWYSMFYSSIFKGFQTDLTVVGSLSSILLQALIVLWHPACSVHAKQQLSKECFFFLQGMGQLNNIFNISDSWAAWIRSRKRHKQNHCMSC